MWEELLQAAVAAREQAYAPYSGSRVGAAALGESGAIYAGANFEFTRYADHGEQVAVHRALAGGEKSVRAVAVFVTEGTASRPCGNCRQALFELNPELEIVSPGLRVPVAELLPHAYQRLQLAEHQPVPYEAVDHPLLRAALAARAHSRAGRTGRPEGAALESQTGQIFAGCKLELSSFPSQAARMALAEAFWHGHQTFRRLCLVSGPGRPALPDKIAWDTLQALHDCSPHLQVVHPDRLGEIREQSLSDFLNYLREQER